MLGLVGRPFIWILLFAALPAPTLIRAQDPAATAAQPHSQVFSGFVTDFTPTTVAVSRKNASGNEMVHKVFVIDAQTKVEGKIKLKARVTVQFMIDADSSRALRVIVR